ncbi:hypothetical protein J6590_108618 [Homalodisca vitripennis]|nr:hypothetical protein J6590_108618 [Homalodisca vitripennis]
MERVLKQQKRAIRCLAGLQFQESCREAFKQLNILTIDLYIQEVILHAVNSGQTRNRDFHHHHTHNALNFTLPVHHLSLSEKKPSYKGALYFNKLPEPLRKEPPKRLKNALTNWLQERPFYSENEFLNNLI